MPTAFAAVYLRRANASWPVDIGDDPSFAWAREHGGPLTWGVCRPDLRNALERGDVVVFFSADRLPDRSPARYAWVGFATVASKVSQSAIFERDDLAPLRARPNLLIRKATSGVFEHHEPALDPRDWHRDWVWRLVRSHRRKKQDFDPVEATGVFDPRSSRAAGSLITLADNYVLFADEDTLTWIAEDPPIIAEAAQNGQAETWMNRPLATELQSLIFHRAPRPSLRTSNPQTAHPELRLAMPPDDVRRELTELASRHGLARRLPASSNAGPGTI